MQTLSVDLKRIRVIEFAAGIMLVYSFVRLLISGDQSANYHLKALGLLNTF